MAIMSMVCWSIIVTNEQISHQQLWLDRMDNVTKRICLCLLKEIESCYCCLAFKHSGILPNLNLC